MICINHFFYIGAPKEILAHAIIQELCGGIICHLAKYIHSEIFRLCSPSGGRKWTGTENPNFGST